MIVENHLCENEFMKIDGNYLWMFNFYLQEFDEFEIKYCPICGEYLGD